MGVEFKPMTTEEREKLTKALYRNAEQNVPLHMDPLTTGWRPGEDEVRDEDVISAIQSVPTHY